MFVFLLRPCQVFRHIKAKFNRIPSVLAVPNDDFMNHWNMSQVILIKGVINTDYDNKLYHFYNKCLKGNIIPKFVIQPQPLDIIQLTKID
jgi:hypothetical protein